MTENPRKNPSLPSATAYGTGSAVAIQEPLPAVAPARGPTIPARGQRCRMAGGRPARHAGAACRRLRSRRRSLSRAGTGLGAAGRGDADERTYQFRSFGDAFAFVRGAGELAEAEFHHPDISFGWGYATVSLRTKKIKGLHENDFIMAVKLDRLAGKIAVADKQVER